jgi:hypothetical protein
MYPVIQTLEAADVPTVKVQFALKQITPLATDVPLAYPVHFGNGSFIPGMTLWDVFFTNALNALLTGNSTIGHFPDRAEIVEKARDFADDMMMVRHQRFAEKPTGDSLELKGSDR